MCVCVPAFRFIPTTFTLIVNHIFLNRLMLVCLHCHVLSSELSQKISTDFYIMSIGGWTIVKRVQIGSPATKPNSPVKTDDYLSIADCTQPNSKYLTDVALRQLQLKIGFKQLRYRCHKQSVGRIFHIMTKNNSEGYRVIHHFIVEPTWPPACGSFVILPDDNSILSQHCSQWGDQRLKNHWGRMLNTLALRMYSRPAFMPGQYDIGFGPYFMCDSVDTLLNTGDFWEFSVR